MDTHTPLRTTVRSVLALVLFFSGGLVVAPKVLASGTVYSPPASIDATGTTDVTAQLESFLKTVPDHSTIRFPSGATYRIEGSLRLDDRHGLTIDGTGATFVVTTDGTNATVGKDHWRWAQNWPRKRGQFVINGGSGLLLRNITIDGPHDTAGANNASYVPALEAQHGVEFFDTNDSVLEGCTIRQVYGDPVSVSGTSENITVRGCTLSHSGRQGITVDEARHVLLENNSLAEIGRSAIDLEPVASHWVVDDVVIRNNTIRRANGYFIAANGTGPVDNIRVEGNTLIGEEFIVYVKDSSGARRKNWTVVDNTTDITFGSPVAALRFTRVDNVVVARNFQKIQSAQSRLAVSIDDTTAASVHDNQFPVEGTTEKGRIWINGTIKPEPYTVGTTAPTTTTTTAPAPTTTTTAPAPTTTTTAPAPTTTTTSTTAPTSSTTRKGDRSTKPGKGNGTAARGG